MTYDSLLRDAINEIPEFKKEYENDIARGVIDSNDGMHVVFGISFTPLLIDEIKKKTSLMKRMMGFVEKMSKSEDKKVVEVCDYSVLEAICDEYEDEVLMQIMGESTKDGFYAIKQYMM